MAYVCNLGTNQQLYLDHQGEQTTVVSAMHAPGQQQQSSSSFHTGPWDGPPQIFRTAQGIFIKLTTQQGEIFIQVQGQTLQITQSTPAIQQAESIQVSQVSAMPGMGMASPMPPIDPMEPMKPMEPMNMGSMQMGLNPMQMQMGNMRMQMGNTTTNNAPAEGSGKGSGNRRFCSQCGQPVHPEDRFCGSCGKALTS